MFKKQHPTEPTLLKALHDIATLQHQISMVTRSLIATKMAANIPLHSWEQERFDAMTEAEQTYLHSLARLTSITKPIINNTITSTNAPVRKNIKTQKSNTRWTKKEDQQLRKLKNSGEYWFHIANVLGRSEKACKARWHKLHPKKG